MPDNAPKKVSGHEDQTATILINLYDGTRELLPGETRVLLRIIDGEQRHVFTDTVKGPTIRVTVPCQDGMRDRYTVLAAADGYAQAGFHPVNVSPTIVRPVFLMLLPRKTRWDFSKSQWDVLRKTHPAFTKLMAHGANSEPQGQARYERVMEQRPAGIACLLNILTVIQDIDLPEGTPLDHMREIQWETVTQDRCFGWADRTLLDQVRVAASQGAFSQEPGPGLLHPGATSSYKQVQFGEANLQITFHEKDQSSGRPDWVKVELDIDYFNDAAAHTLLEVLPNAFGSTDPRRVYVLRWIAGRQANVPAFNPPYTIRPSDS